MLFQVGQVGIADPVLVTLDPMPGIDFAVLGNTHGSELPEDFSFVHRCYVAHEAEGLLALPP